MARPNPGYRCDLSLANLSDKKGRNLNDQELLFLINSCEFPDQFHLFCPVGSTIFPENIMKPYRWLRSIFFGPTVPRIYGLGLSIHKSPIVHCYVILFGNG